MHISVVGSGYVGNTVAACLADLGHQVTNVDVDESVVATINAGEAPIHEDGLPELVARHVAETGRLRATTDYDAVHDTDLTFVCLPTPSNEDGSIDRSIVEAGAEQLGETSPPKTTGTPSLSRAPSSPERQRTASRRWSPTRAARPAATTSASG